MSAGSGSVEKQVARSTRTSNTTTSGASGTSTKVTHITTFDELILVTNAYKHKLARLLPRIPIARVKKTVSGSTSSSARSFTTVVTETYTPAMSDLLIEKTSLTDIYQKVSKLKKISTLKYAMMKIQARMFIGMKIGGANNGIVDEANASKWIVISKDLHDSLTSKEKDEWKLLCALCIASEGGQKLDALADDETAFDEGEFDLLEEEEEEGAVPMSPGPMGRQRISSPITSSGSSTKHMFPHLHGTQTPLSYTSTRVSKHEYSASEADARRDSIRSNSSAGHGFRRSKTLSPEELAGMELDEQRTDIAQQSKLRRRQAEDQLRPPNEVLSHAHHHHHHHIRPDSVSSSGSRSEQSLCSGCGGLRDSGGQQVAPTPGPRSSSRANPTSVDKSPPLTPSRPKSSQNTTYDARGISSKPSKASRGSRDASKESRRGNSEGSNPSSSSHGVRSKIVTRTDYGAVDTDEQGERDAAFSEIDWANLSLNPPQVPEREHQHQHAAPQDVRRKK